MVRGRIQNGGPANSILDGGPLDGREHLVDADTEELLVQMEDGSIYLYAISEKVQRSLDGRLLPVYEYRGRNFPLRSSDD